MTAEQPLDRTTRAWLDLMPDEAPDRVIDAVLQAVEAAPQVRRPWLAGPTRSIRMNRLIPIAAVAVISVALLGGGAIIAGGRAGPAPTQAPQTAPPVAPSATPAAKASPSQAAVAVPKSLQSFWAGGSHVLPRLGSLVRTDLLLGPTGGCITTGTDSAPCLAVSSELTTMTPDSFSFTTTTADDCAVGDAGSYPWALSAGGSVLTIGSGTDACADRAAAYEGTWYRIACKAPADGCMGDLEAGTYPSQFITPRLAPATAWQPAFGAITYTVPAGWSNSADFPMELVLLPSSTYATFSDQGGPANVYHQVQVLADPGPVKQDAACTNAIDTSVNRTADGMADWIANNPAFTVTNAQSGPLDGHHARRMDLAVNPASAARCPGDTLKSGSLFAPVRQDTGNVPNFGIAEGELIRLWLIDLGGGHVAAVVIDDTDGTGRPNAARFQSLLDAATPIVQSLHFK
jgi:hypothetical protein